MATILVVDDNATNRALLARTLQRHDHRVVEAANGAEALGLIWVDRPDLIITDILMPKVDGYAFDRELRRFPQTASIPIIFHTAAYTSREVRELVGSSSHRRVLPKPSDLDTVLETVASLLTVQDGAGADGAGEDDADDPHAHLAMLNLKLIQKIRELEVADRDRQRLLAHVVRAQEEERERIAGDIHDDSVQAMTAVAMRLELTAPDADDAAAVARHDKLLATVREAIARLRRLLFQLHPVALGAEGLGAALEAYLDNMVEGDRPRYVVVDELDDEPRSELRALLYRVVQEAVGNALKHADAEVLRVELRDRDDGFHAVVTDDGCGFVVGESDGWRWGHLGLTSMRQRVELVGGWLKLDSAPGKGTTVEAWVPDVMLEGPQA